MTISCLLANTVQAARGVLDGTHGDTFTIDWAELPDRSMIFGEQGKDAS